MFRRTVISLLLLALVTPSADVAFARTEMPSLSPQQQRTARIATRTARRLGANRREILALLSSGLVESNLRQIHYGDRDSQGFLQQRPSQGWGPYMPGARGIRADTRDFISRAKGLRGTGRKPWMIAADVQRPAEQYRTRYRDRMGEARAILRELGGGGGAVAGRVLASYGVPELAQQLGLSTADLSGLLPQRTPPPVSAPAEPAFSARARIPMPNGAHLVPAASGPPAPKVDVLQLLSRAVQGGDLGLTPLTGGQGGQQQLVAGGGGGRRAKVVLAPTADRAGVATSRRVRRFVSEVGGLAGVGKLTIGTGTNHDQYTVNGNVSNHWGGNAADVPARGRRLIALGQAALIAAGMPERKARRQTGGLFNVGGWEIIFNTQEGGDHRDHLHAGWQGR